jgi:flagellar basal-body rod protein FlgG
MQRSLWSAATGMQAQQLNVDIIANNLANISTTGFKKSRADFHDLMYQTLQAPGMASSSETMVPTGMQVGLGVRTAAVQRMFMQGDYTKTDNELDLAIDGDGFFQVLLPDGETGYTRSGAFKLDRDGRIVNSDGYVVLPEMTIPSDTTKINVGTDGTVSVTQAGQTNPTELGTLELAQFANPAGLDGLGRTLFKPSESSGDAVTGTAGQDGFGGITQGFLEMANVNVVDEMVAMIIGQRAYEANSKAVQTSDSMLQIVNNLKR